MKLIIVFFGFLLLSLSASAQIKNEKEQLQQIIRDFDVEEKYRNESYRDQFLISSNLYYRSKDIDFNYGMVFGLLEMARCELQMGNLSSCLKLANQGLTIADRFNYISEKVSLLRYVGLSLADQGYYSKGKSNLLNALDLSEFITDKNERYWKKLSLYRSLVEFYDGRHNEAEVNNDSVLYYLKMGYKESRKVDSNNYYFDRAKILGELEYINTLLFYSEIKNKEKNIKIAKERLSNISALIEEKNYKEKLVIVYMINCSIEQQKGNIDSALFYCEKSLPLLNHFNGNFYAHNVYQIMSDLYGKKGDYKREAYFLKMSKFLSDSIHNEVKDAIRLSLPLIQDKKVNSSSYSYIFYISFASFLAILIYFWRLKIAKKKNIAPKQQDHKVKSPATNEHELPLDKERILNVINLAKSNSELFYISFLELYPNFKNKLLRINPQLTVADCEFCALLKLNFDTKQIARYRNLSIRSVDSKKYRIRKKLGLTSEDDIYDYFIDF